MFKESKRTIIFMNIKHRAHFIHSYFPEQLVDCFILQMSDYDDEFDSAPNYEKMRGMGFICWREIPGTNDNEVS